MLATSHIGVVGKPFGSSGRTSKFPLVTLSSQKADLHHSRDAILVANNLELKDLQFDVKKDIVECQYLITIKQKDKNALLGFVSLASSPSDGTNPRMVR